MVISYDSPASVHMRHVTLGLMLGLTVFAGSFLTIASADHPPRPGSDDSDLDENETATLWSKEPNECLSDHEYEQRYGEERTTIHALGNCTDITFRDPPETAEVWTAHDFESLEPGETGTSVYPAHANRTGGRFIKDAHATTFAVQPSTRVHLDDEDTPLYLAPDGELRGLVDYRVEVPEDEVEGNRTIAWSLLEDEVTTVRLRQDDDLMVTEAGQHTPVLDYELDGSGPSTLTFEAEIEVELEKEVTQQGGNGTRTRYEYLTETVTASQTVAIEVYDLTAYVYHAEYPDGDVGVAIYQSQPWHGYTLTEDGEAGVRGVWRYYTARDTDWDSLIHATEADQETVDSDALPVYTRAYPSEIGPQAHPIRDGPAIQEVWGADSESPASTLHENVEIGIIDEEYVRSHGVAVQYEEIDRGQIDVQGIVRGESADIVEPEAGTEREIRESEVTVDILQQNRSAATLRIELRDAETGDPLALEDPWDEHSRVEPIGHDQREGYITIGNERVETNSSGVATVTVRSPGVYTAEYQPGSWRTHEPAYVRDRASVTWHPLDTASGWFALIIDVVWMSIPFLVALYAGLKLGAFLNPPASRYP